MHPRSPFKLQFQTKSPWSKKKKRKNVHNFANSTKKFNPYKMFFKTVLHLNFRIVKLKFKMEPEPGQIDGFGCSQVRYPGSETLLTG